MKQNVVEIVKTWRVRRQCEKRFMASISCLPSACAPLNKMLLYTFNSIATIYQAHETFELANENVEHKQ